MTNILFQLSWSAFLRLFDILLCLLSKIISCSIFLKSNYSCRWQSGYIKLSFSSILYRVSDMFIGNLCIFPLTLRSRQKLLVIWWLIVLKINILWYKISDVYDNFYYWKLYIIIDNLFFQFYLRVLYFFIIFGKRKKPYFNFFILLSNFLLLEPYLAFLPELRFMFYRGFLKYACHKFYAVFFLCV